MRKISGETRETLSKLTDKQNDQSVQILRTFVFELMFCTSKLTEKMKHLMKKKKKEERKMKKKKKKKVSIVKLEKKKKEKRKYKQERCKNQVNARVRHKSDNDIRELR